MKRLSIYLLLALGLTACGTFVVDITAEQRQEESAAPEWVQSEAATVQPMVGETILPAPLLFINAEDGQIWRVERDGRTLSPVTDEPAPITDFDVSPKDGALIYVSNNELIYFTSALGGRRVVLFGRSPEYDENDYISVLREQVSNPRWSPDGNLIMFGAGGINLYLDPSIPRQEENPEIWGVLPNDPLPDAIPEGEVYEEPQTVYTPVDWSPDGRYLLVNVSYAFALGPSMAIVELGDGTGAMRDAAQITEISDVTCCLDWAGDGTALYHAGRMPGMFATGLRRFDPFGGESTVLIPEVTLGTGGDEGNLFLYPFMAPSDLIYGFYAAVPHTPDIPPSPYAPTRMVSITGDGTMQLTDLRMDSYVVGGAVWAADGSGAVIAAVTGDYGWPPSGGLRWLPSNGDPAVEIPAEGHTLRWGTLP